MESSAVLSDDRIYRYLLWRKWDDSLPSVVFIGLNPSTADESSDDPTVRRCLAYAKDWGFGSLCMANLFAFRATDPSELRTVEDPVGPENDMHIKSVVAKAGLVVAAWGNHGNLRNRSHLIRNMVNGLHCLKVTANGEPNHPLYLSRELKPVPLDQATQGFRQKPKALGSELQELEKKEILDLFVGQVVHIHQVFTTILNFYERTDPGILHEAADDFFEFLYRLLSNTLILEITKLTDPELTSGRENLTIRYVASNLLKKSTRTSLEVETCLTNVLQFGLIVGEARNKIIGHSDLETYRQKSVLSTFEKNELEQFFVSLSEFCDILSKEITGSILGDIYTGRAGDELDLIQKIRRGIAYQKAFDAGDYEMRSYLFSLLPK